MILTARPLLEQECRAIRLEAAIRARETLAEQMEDVPSLKAETEPVRFPKWSRRKPRATAVVYRRLADAALPQQEEAA